MLPFVKECTLTIMKQVNVKQFIKYTKNYLQLMTTRLFTVMATSILHNCMYTLYIYIIIVCVFKQFILLVRFL